MEEKISFIPQGSAAIIEDCITIANNRLDHLRALMAEHGEGSEELKEYIQKGAEFRIEERKAEITAWMDATKMPSYARARYMSDALEDLGAVNTRYWKMLGEAMVIRAGKGSVSPKLDLANDVDYSDAGWRVSETWKARELQKVTVTLPEWMAKDLINIKGLLEAVEVYYKYGYDLEDAMRWFIEFGTRPDLCAEDIYNCYSAERDMRQKK